MQLAYRDSCSNEVVWKGRAIKLYQMRFCTFERERHLWSHGTMLCSVGSLMEPTETADKLMHMIGSREGGP